MSQLFILQKAYATFSNIISSAFILPLLPPSLRTQLLKNLPGLWQTLQKNILHE